MEILAALAPESSADVITLEAWSKEWLGFSVHLKPKTQVGYQSLLSARILPTFGRLPLGAIQGLAIRRWVAEMHAGGLSASRVKQSHQVLRQILNSAVDCGLLDHNPSQGVKLPRDARSEMACLTAEEVERLAAVVPTPYQSLIHVLAYGGLRWGEATARSESTRLNSSHMSISYAVFCLKKKKKYNRHGIAPFNEYYTPTRRH